MLNVIFEKSNRKSILIWSDTKERITNNEYDGISFYKPSSSDSIGNSIYPTLPIRCRGLLIHCGEKRPLQYRGCKCPSSPLLALSWG